MKKLTILFLSLITCGALANDNILNKASRLYEVDIEQAIQTLRINEPKFKTINEKLNLANWYFSHGYKSIALSLYEDIILLDSSNIDALLNRNIILTQKLALPSKLTYDQLLPYYDSAIKQRNIRYFNYLGYLALSFDASIARDAFEHAVIFGDVTESYLGLGLALEQLDIPSAIKFYSNLMSNNIFSEEDQGLIQIKMKGLQQ